MLQSISVVIAAYNNEKKIRQTLESVKWADEIIIVDGYSDDKTKDICKEYTDKIYLQPNHPQWNVNKNYGFNKASSDWILNLDSDETVTAGLRNEIEEILAEGTVYDFFYIPRREHFFGQWIKSIWGPEPAYVKLFKKGVAEYEGRHLHEPMRTKGNKGVLKGHIVHNAYLGIHELLTRIDAFTDQEAICMKRDGFKLKWWHFIIRPGRYVYYALIKRGGFKNGWKEWLTIILWCGYYQFISLVKLFKLEKSKK